MKYKATIKQGLFLLKIVKGKRLPLFFLLALAVFPLPARAQMFSADEEDPLLNVPFYEVYFGYELTDVNYRGEGTAVFAFEGPVLRLGFDSPALDLSLASGGRITGLDNIAYFDFGGKIQVNLNLYNTAGMALILPLEINSRYTTITNSRRFTGSLVSNRFRFGNLTGGAGLKIYVRPFEYIRAEGMVIPSYGFAFASGGLFGGSLGTLKAGGRLYFDRLFGELGLSLGYFYKTRNYDIDENFYDYLINVHSLQLGITF